MLPPLRLNTNQPQQNRNASFKAFLPWNELSRGKIGLIEAIAVNEGTIAKLEKAPFIAEEIILSVQQTINYLRNLLPKPKYYDVN